MKIFGLILKHILTRKLFLMKKIYSKVWVKMHQIFSLENILCFKKYFVTKPKSKGKVTDL